MLYLCRRGRENLHELKVTDFKIGINANGKRFVEKSVDELSKNRRDEDAADGGIVLETGRENCPVKLFEKYVLLLNPKIPNLFQRAKQETPSAGFPWYDAIPVGKNKLGSLMK